MKKSLFILCLLSAASLQSCVVFEQGPSFQNPALFQAIRQNDLGVAQQLINSGCSLYDPAYGNLLHAACSSNKQTINYVFSFNPDIECKDAFGNTPLFCAGELMMDELLKRGADIEAINEEGKTPFAYIAATLVIVPDKTLPRLDKLLAHGANINAIWDSQTVMDYWLQSAEDHKTKYRWEIYGIDWFKLQSIMVPFLRERGAKTYRELKKA